MWGLLRLAPIKWISEQNSSQRETNNSMELQKQLNNMRYDWRWVISSYCMYLMRPLASQMLCIIANHAVLTKIQDGVVGNLAAAAIFL